MALSLLRRRKKSDPTVLAARDKLLATPTPKIVPAIREAETLAAAGPGAQIDPTTNKTFIGKAGAAPATGTPGMVTMRPGYRGSGAAEAVVPAAAGAGILRRRTQAESPARAVGQIAKADPAILTEGLQGRASGAGLSHLFPQTYGGAATNPLRAAQEQDMVDMRHSFKSPLLRRKQDKREAATLQAGVLRGQRAHEIDLAKAQQKPLSVITSKEKYGTKTKTPLTSEEETAETTRLFTPGGQEVDPVTGQPFSAEQLAEFEQAAVEESIVAAEDALGEATKGFKIGRYNDKKLPAAKTAIKAAVKTALGKTASNEDVDAILKRLAGDETLADILADAQTKAP